MREDEKILKRLAAGRCRYNDGIQCDDAWQSSRCLDCGWNPRVHEKRKKRRRDREHG